MTMFYPWYDPEANFPQMQLGVFVDNPGKFLHFLERMLYELGELRQNEAKLNYVRASITAPNDEINPYELEREYKQEFLPYMNRWGTLFNQINS